MKQYIIVINTILQKLQNSDVPELTYYTRHKDTQHFHCYLTLLKLSGTVIVSGQVSKGENLKFSGTVNVYGQVSEGDSLKPSGTVNMSVSGQCLKVNPVELSTCAGSSKTTTTTQFSFYVYETQIHGSMPVIPVFNFRKLVALLPRSIFTTMESSGHRTTRCCKMMKKEEKKSRLLLTDW